MTIELETDPNGPLEDVAYLSRSGNRLQILDALATRAYARHELEARTTASRPTLRRILNELTERGWVERTVDGDYVATAKGEHVIAAFTPLVGAMQTVRRLGEAVAWLPTEELTIGLHHFSDATVRRASPNDPVAEASYLLDLLRDRVSSAYPRLPVSDERSDSYRNRGANRRGSSGHTCCRLNVDDPAGYPPSVRLSCWIPFLGTLRQWREPSPKNKGQRWTRTSPFTAMTRLATGPH
jgi:DNA-binding HxlR family transcriptional regulator